MRRTTDSEDEADQEEDVEESEPDLDIAGHSRIERNDVVVIHLYVED